jgi:hypothetical protein
MALNAGFLVWEAASVVAGVFSFGTATVAMAGAKAGVRGLIKAGGKVALGMAKKQMASLATKSLALKAGLKNIRPFLAKIPRICVTACFPAGTPVAVEGGYKNIEELQVGGYVPSMRRRVTWPLSPCCRPCNASRTPWWSYRLGPSTLLGQPHLDRCR